jgi:hypothetical protein
MVLVTSRDLAGLFVQGKHARGGFTLEDDVLRIGVVTVTDGDEAGIPITMGPVTGILVVEVTRNDELDPLLTEGRSVGFHVLPFGVILGVEIVGFD